MTEREVRDAYSLAHRSSDRRQQSWIDHSLPVRVPEAVPWVAVSALPLEPLSEILDLRSTDLGIFHVPPPLRHYISHTGLDFALLNIRPWADGLTADDGHDDNEPKTVVRLHTDGAGGFARELQIQIDPDWISRVFNAFLVYLSWYWHEFNLQRPVELELVISGLTGCSLPVGAFNFLSQPVVQPSGMNIDRLLLREEVLPWELGRAAVRHRVIRKLNDRLSRAFGKTNPSALFERGWLFNHEGVSTDLNLNRSMIWDQKQNQSAASIDAEGRVKKPSSGAVVGHFLGGVIIDPRGYTLATLEMAEGSGCPDDFLPVGRQIPPPPPDYDSQPAEPSSNEVAPDPKGLWSDQRLIETLAP